jgi:hypothetical protein
MTYSFRHRHRASCFVSSQQRSTSSSSPHVRKSVANNQALFAIKKLFIARQTLCCARCSAFGVKSQMLYCFLHFIVMKSVWRWVSSERKRSDAMFVLKYETRTFR